ncbi:DNA polymerase alpha accessory factor Mcl1 [Leucoagaricus gongylophorus]
MSTVDSNPAHPDGYTCLTYSPDGSYIYTGGTDYLVRIWSLDNNMNEPESATDAEHGITSLSASHDFWLSASDDLVRRYVKHESQLHGFVTNTNGVRIRSVSIDPKAKRIAVASDELFIKIIDAEDNTIFQKLEGHSKGVRRVTWDPTSMYLTSCGSDGKIFVWDMSAKEAKIKETLDGIIPIIADQESDEFKFHDCSAVWHPSGNCFYTVSRTHEIVTISTADWTKSSGFVDKDILGAVTALALSPNGVYLASACRSNIYIWSTRTQRIVTHHVAKQSDGVVTCLVWCPNRNHLAWTDNNGEFFQWHNPISGAHPDPVKKIDITNGSLTISVKPKTGLDLFGEEPANTHELVGATAEETPDIDADADDDYDNWIVDDLGGGMQDELAVGNKPSDGHIKEMVSITKAQPPFQPGSTPMDNKRCFLAYNLIGVIEVTDQDTYHIINVDFFDRSIRKSYHFTDDFKHNLGYLGERGAVFACPPEGEHPAQVLFKPYGTWTSQKEWTYKLRDRKSHILGIATGGVPPALSLRETTDSDIQGYGEVIVATNEGDLTFLSGTGRERRIMGLGGDFVSMVAGSEWVFVVYRAGSTTIDGSQNLSYCIINFDDFSVRQRDILPLLKGHTLKWIGLTDQGAPATYDTTGCIHVLTKFRTPHHASWARILDTNLLDRKQGKDESYWPVGISENTFHCLILKGRQEHPGFPRPLIQELPVALPFRRNEPKEETVERQLLYTETALDLLSEELTTEDILMREHSIDRELILLIQAACKTDNTARAIELTKLLHHLPTYDAAIKIAGFYHLVGLQEKLEVLRVRKEEAEDRFEVLRQKRRRWLKSNNVPRDIQYPNDANTNGRYDPLGDVRPPFAIDRPGMERVTVPVIERTKFSSSTAHSSTIHLPYQQQSTTRSPSPIPTEETESQNTTILTTTQKRKRSDVDDINASQFSDASVMPPPPKQKTNPFKRKNPTNLPNARESIRKSDSFFDKVEAVESYFDKKAKKPLFKSPKDKEGPRQATLFGMMPRAFQTSQAPKRGVEEKQIVNGDEDIDEETQSVLDIGLGPEAMEESDSQMTLNDSRGLGDTQFDQETQMD